MLMIILDFEIKHRHINIFRPLTTDKSRMDSRSNRVRIVSVHTRSPKRPPCANFLTMARIETETRNTDGKCAVLLPFKSRKRDGRGVVSEFGTFMGNPRCRRMYARSVERGTKVVTRQLSDTSQQRLQVNSSCIFPWRRGCRPACRARNMMVMVMMMVMVVDRHSG